MMKKTTTPRAANRRSSGRRRPSAGLTGKQQYYRELFDNVAIGLCRTTPGPEGAFIDANPAMVRMFEADSRAQLLDLHPSEIYADADQRRIVSEAIMSQGFIKGQEVLLKTLKGKQIWCRITAVKKTGTNGQVYFNNTIEDISERKEQEDLIQAQNEELRAANEELTSSEEELKANEEELEQQMGELQKSQEELDAERQRYRELFENVLVGVCQTTPGPEGSFVDANPAMLMMFEADSREQLLNLHPNEIYFDQSQRRIVSDAIMSQGFVKGQELKYKTLKGNPIWCRITAFRKTNTNGQVYFFNTVENIDARKAAEEKLQTAHEELQANYQEIEASNQELHAADEELRQQVEELEKSREALRTSEMRYRRLFEAAQDGVLILNADTGVIEDANPFIKELLGYPREELMGKELWQIGLFRDIVASRDSFMKLKHKEYIRYDNLPLQTKDGRKKEVEFVSNVYGVGDHKVIQCNIRDVTARYRAEQALRESERRLRETQEMAQLGQWSWDIKTGAVEWSEEVFRIFKLAPATFKPQIDSILALSPWPEDHQRDQELIRRAMETHEKGTYEQRFLRPDRSIGYYHSTFQGKYDEKGELVTIVGTVMDITERKRAEAALRESEEQLRLFVDYAPAAIAMFDHNMRYLAASYRWLSDYKLEGLVIAGKSHYELFPKIPERWKVAHQQAMNGSVLRATEDTYQRDDGTIQYLWWEVRPWKTAAGDIGGIVIFTEDITERKRAEEALRESQAMYQAIFEATGTATMIVEEDTTIVMANNECLPVTGYSPSELIGTKWPTYVAPESMELMKKFHALRRAEPGKAPNQYEVTLVNKKGELRFAMLDVGMIPNTKQSVVSMLDITERKRAEEALRTNQEQLDNAMDIAHLGHWEYDVITDTFTFNDNFYKIFRTTAEKVGGYTMRSADYARRFVHPEDAPIVAEEVRKSISATSPSYSNQLEHRIIYDDGSVGYINVKHFAVKDSQNKTIKTYGVNQDITERKQAEEAIRALSSRQEALLAAIPEIIMEVDTNKVYTWANRTGLGFFGDDVIGHEAAHYFEGKQKTYEAVQPLLDGTEDLIYVESLQRRKDGQKRLLAWWCRTLKNERGEVTGVLSSAQDITERKLADEQIKKHLAELQRWQSSMLDREDRVRELKREINELLAQAGRPPRYIAPVGKVPKSQEGRNE